jgi:hypothetical protein
MIITEAMRIASAIGAANASYSGRFSINLTRA